MLCSKILNSVLYDPGRFWISFHGSRFCSKLLWFIWFVSSNVSLKLPSALNIDRFSISLPRFKYIVVVKKTRVVRFRSVFVLRDRQDLVAVTDSDQITLYHRNAGGATV